MTPAEREQLTQEIIKALLVALLPFWPCEGAVIGAAVARLGLLLDDHLSRMLIEAERVIDDATDGAQLRRLISQTKAPAEPEPGLYLHNLDDGGCSILLWDGYRWEHLTTEPDEATAADRGKRIAAILLVPYRGLR